MYSKKKLLGFITAIALVISLSPISAFATTASQYADMPNDWSTTALESSVANGLLNGTDGKILPNDNLTRAQMATIIVRAFGATVKGDISSFSDVKSTDWFSDNMAKAYQMGVIKGFDGKMDPNAAITREEVFVILARALKLTPAAAVNKSFSDIESLSDWAKSETYSLINSGYISGSEGYLQPGANITRAQFAQIIYNIVKQYYNTSGTYTTASSGNLMINTPGVILKNITVTGDLIIGDGVGDGEVTLDNVKVNGRLVVRGGGENSVIIKGNSSVSNIIVARVDGAVSVKVQGDANVEVIYIDDGSDDVRIEGSVGTVEVAASGIEVTTAGATIEKMNVTAADSKVVIGAGSTVKTLEVKASASNADVQVTGKVTNISTSAAGTQVSGTGTVTKVEAQEGANGTSIETKGTKITVDSSVTGVTAGGGTSVAAGSTVTNNTSGTGTTTTTGGGSSGGDDGGGPSITPITAVAIAGTASPGSVLTATPTPASATATYQWMVCDTAGGTYTNISGATNSTYTIDSAYVGKYIKVTATGSGSYSASVTSSSENVLYGITATPISFGAPNPSTSVSLTGDTYSAGAETIGNWTFNYGTTGLTVSAISLQEDAGTATGVTIDFTGTAASGTLTITPDAAALTNGTTGGSTASMVIAPDLDLSSVGIDVAGGKIAGTETTMQYSLDSTSGTDGTWTDCTATNTTVAFNDGPVYVRAKAQTSNFRLVATIAAAAAAPTLVSDDVANTITGLDATYEYKVDAGDWTAGTVAGDFAGDKTVLVRLKATASALASQEQTINFTENAPTAVTFSGLTADGDNNTTTKVLTLTFDVDPTSLTVNHITVTGVTKGTLTGTGTTRTLTISDIKQNDVTVTIANPPGFEISPASKGVTVFVKAELE